uniref:Uncharacterized protein n=1 Tax=Cucumis melo TaxID=3656 RepID=A0A9I9E6M3_CUCME
RKQETRLRRRGKVGVKERRGRVVAKNLWSPYPLNLKKC